MSAENNQIFETNWTETIMSFDKMDLKEDLLYGIYGYGFERPSTIQQLAIKPIISGRDTIAQAQSGTGKTATFAISVLQRIDLSDRSTQAIILAPTRELAQQSVTVIRGIGSKLGVSCYGFIGGIDVAQDENALAKGVQVAVGCPGRLLHMIKNRKLHTDKVKMFILDEADEMLSRGFTDQINDIFRELPQDVQVCLISATLPQEVLEVTSSFMRNPVRILVKESELSLQGIRQYYINVGQDQWKYETLTDIYKVLAIQQAVIFCDSVNKVRELEENLNKSGHAVSCIHREMEQAQRDEIMSQFRLGKIRVLVATNIIARGIDVQNVSLVINYDIPKNPETYLHRIGRSGRFGRKGVAINFVTDRDEERIQLIKDKYNTQIDELPKDLSKIF